MRSLRVCSHSWWSSSGQILLVMRLLCETVIESVAHSSAYMSCEVWRHLKANLCSCHASLSELRRASGNERSCWGLDPFCIIQTIWPYKLLDTASERTNHHSRYICGYQDHKSHFFLLTTTWLRCELECCVRRAVRSTENCVAVDMEMAPRQTFPAGPSRLH